MKFLIEKFILGSKINIYAIRYINEKNELDKYNELQNFFITIKRDYPQDHDIFKAVIKNITNISGAKRKFFKDETNSSCDYLYALINNDDEGRHYSGELRLFCLRFDDEKIIFGNGGIKPKDARTFNEVSKLNTIARILQKICSIIIDKEKDGEFYWENKELKSKTNLIIEFEL